MLIEMAGGARQVLSSYLRQQMGQGRVREMNPDVGAQAFLNIQ